MALSRSSCFTQALALAAWLLWLSAAHADNRGPDWAQLSPSQQQVLAPLKEDWVNIEGPRRLKWIEIAKHYANMTPAQQARLQTRMRQWASLSAEERAQVRERYKRLQEMPPEKREEIRRKWHEYDSLTEEEKDTLRQAHPTRPAAKP